MEQRRERSYADTDKYFIGFFLTILFILFLRSPEIILKGRFWAEDGTVYFKYAFEHSVFNTLFFVDIRCGYYYFSAVLSALAASLVPLEYAPFISTMFSYLIIAAVIYAIYFTPSYILKNNFMKILFCMYLIIGSQAVAEVYCNTVNTQVYWGIFGVAALFFDYAELQNKKKSGISVHRWFLDGMLIAGCLSGLYCVIMLPFFVIRWFLLKDKVVRRETICMLIPFILQGGIVLYAKFSSGLSSSKLHLSSFDLDGVKYSLLHQFIKPLVGNRAAEVPLGLMILLMLIICLICAYINRSSKKLLFLQISLIMLYVYYFIYVQFGGMGEGGKGGRYAFVAGSIEYLLLLFCICGIYRKLKLRGKNIIILLVFLPLLAGGCSFQDSHEWQALDGSKAPDWKQEVERYQMDHNYELQIWPYHVEGWRIRLETADK